MQNKKPQTRLPACSPASNLQLSGSITLLFHYNPIGITVDTLLNLLRKFLYNSHPALFHTLTYDGMRLSEFSQLIGIPTAP
ncbi:hypothetical protein [Paenibacillus xylanexedens]|uniref:hypothetical protein n=1 Tax=Paenibacillus xylanexedens TaxID=528191 RepID=UPI0016436966